MNKKAFGLLLSFALVAATSVFAASEGPGCGLGKGIFTGKKGLFPHTLAATSNGTSGNNTFGMTSGTSGCDTDKVILKEKEQEVFVALNMENLHQELAQGRGEYLRSLAGLMGCSGSYDAFAGKTREKYAALFAGEGTTAAGFLANLKRELAADPRLSASCTRIS